MGNDMEYEEERKDRPCPATKRNGEACESTLVSASGYCFAHDPEATEWRAMGGRASSKRRRATKRIRESGMGHILKMLEGTLAELHSGEGNAEDARAMARVTEAILKMAELADEGEGRDGQRRWPTMWEEYQV